MAASVFQSLSDIILPKGRGVKEGRGYTPTFDPRNSVLSVPLYRDHLQDVYTTRAASDSRALIEQFANFDPDVSAAINAYLALAGSVDPVIYAYDEQDEIDPDGITLGQQILAALTTTNDYSIGYSRKPTVDELSTQHRYLILLRGATAAELVLNKAYIPYELRLVDPGSLEWNEIKPGVYTPVQKPAGTNAVIDLNIPTFFTSSFHQSPLDIYTYSTFVAAINTIASRQLVINELYRIMKIVGYPRVDVQVLEEVLAKAAPASYRNNPEQMRSFVESELNKIRVTLSGLGSADAFVHSSAIEAKIINEKNPSAGLQIENVIDVLNAQNQAALKVMPSVVGKGENGQVASTEARLFALSADALNRSVGDLFTKALTLAARLSGYAGRIECIFPPIELRPDLELEAQRTMKASRLKADLDLGIITDIEYTMEMYSRPPLKGAPELSGTGFLKPDPAAGVEVDAEKVTPNTDSLGRSLSGEGGNGVGRDNNASKGRAKK
jgi:hypothetical protein